MARSKKQIWYYDLDRIAQHDADLSPHEREVQARLSHDPWPQVYAEETVEGWLQQLTPQQRRVAELLQAGYSYRQAARMLGVSLMRIRQLVAAIRQRLKKALLEDGR